MMYRGIQLNSGAQQTVSHHDDHDDDYHVKPHEPIGDRQLHSLGKLVESHLRQRNKGLNFYKHLKMQSAKQKQEVENRDRFKQIALAQEEAEDEEEVEQEEEDEQYQLPKSIVQGVRQEFEKGMMLNVKDEKNFQKVLLLDIFVSKKWRKFDQEDEKNLERLITDIQQAAEKAAIQSAQNAPFPEVLEPDVAQEIAKRDLQQEAQDQEREQTEKQDIQDVSMAKSDNLQSIICDYDEDQQFSKIYEVDQGFLQDLRIEERQKHIDEVDRQIEMLRREINRCQVIEEEQASANELEQKQEDYILEKQDEEDFIQPALYDLLDKKDETYSWHGFHLKKSRLNKPLRKDLPIEEASQKIAEEQRVFYKFKQARHREELAQKEQGLVQRQQSLGQRSEVQDGAAEGYGTARFGLRSKRQNSEINGSSQDRSNLTADQFFQNFDGQLMPSYDASLLRNEYKDGFQSSKENTSYKQFFDSDDKSFQESSLVNSFKKQTKEPQSYKIFYNLSDDSVPTINKSALTVQDDKQQDQVPSSSQQQDYIPSSSQQQDQIPNSSQEQDITPEIIFSPAPPNVYSNYNNQKKLTYENFYNEQNSSQEDSESYNNKDSSH